LLQFHDPIFDGIVRVPADREHSFQSIVNIGSS
jgi:hypothetical protein